MISTPEANRLRNSARCPGCGGQKMNGRPLCSPCLRVLPDHMRTAVLFREIGHGFERAYEEAIRCVKSRLVTAKEMRAGRHTRK